ncbi:cytochrome C oxidase subunit IV family protein [Sulfurimonas sp. SAG-AH-194-I05]|nr:cytochrome C oxidase subunit IV family protein [Sulfurimonas sp. SAG-AH-194-I05]MDF1874138.1 cytochrome C oxidase subunit IV family protein [Sulfurimonas sp. SAG-AH-194-I05]
MSTTNLGSYKEAQSGYIKILVGLLVLTTVTFVQPHMFLTDMNLGIQLFIGVVKAYLILAYYMHLKGETQIIWFAGFSLFIVAVFFIIVIGFDVANFQYMDESHITQHMDAPHASHATH